MSLVLLKEEFELCQFEREIGYGFVPCIYDEEIYEEPHPDEWEYNFNDPEYIEDQYNRAQAVIRDVWEYLDDHENWLPF